jgi:tRNA threonylcarbamoyladenosine biosynthesis protein TsaE
MVDSTSELQLTCKGLGDLPVSVSRILDFGKGIPVWLFKGDLGAGKTTTIKELCRQLKCIDDPSSPTFNIINEYLTEEGEPIYHFDFYRIKSEEEAYDLGVEEYFDSGYYCFVEWPEKIQSLWSDQYLLIDITTGESDNRIFQIRKYD